jgi:hypothetical protein
MLLKVLMLLGGLPTQKKKLLRGYSMVWCVVESVIVTIAIVWSGEVSGNLAAPTGGYHIKDLFRQPNTSEHAST